MDKKANSKNLLITFLIIVIIFAIWYLMAEKQGYEITRNRLMNIQSQLEQEKQEYKIQSEKLNTDLETLNNELAALNSDLESAKSQLKRLKTLETDNANLLRIKQELEQKAQNLEKEKQLIEARLHSLPELKKLVRQVKIEISGQITQQRIAEKLQQEELDAQKTAQGNRGFIIRGSKSTYKPTIKISVKPAN